MYRRQSKLRECIPRGYALVQATGDGNCLFYSVSTALNGDESLGTSLRLLAVLHAVQHFSHYVEVVSYHMLLSWHFITASVAYSQFSSQLEDPGMAVQFLASVSTDEAFQNRPKLKPTKEELVCYTLQQEIMQTSKLNSFSGFYLYVRSYISPYTGINGINTSNADTGWLQVQFLAGSLQRPIYQISEEQHLPLYNMPLFPCSCCKDITRDPIMIMWLRMKEPDTDNPNPAINHIAPLVPLSGILHSSWSVCARVRSWCVAISPTCMLFFLNPVRVTTHNVRREDRTIDLCKAVSQHCAMGKLQQCTNCCCCSKH